MSERKWTDAQLEAIYVKDKDILVSAAAGSGKTAVLTKRIIEKLTSKDEPADISRMLIVTFTKAAANELKERISAALSEAISKDPFNKRLKHQFVLLKNAKISTIHGFCLDLIKKYFDKAGLTPSISVSDQAETVLMMENVADVVIDSYYSSIPSFDNIENFAEFADNFISLKDENLSKLLISVYKKISSFPRGVEFLSDSAKELDKVIEEGIFSSVYGEIILNRISDASDYFKNVFYDACKYFEQDEIFSEKYLPSFEHDYTYTVKLLDAVSKHDFALIKELLCSYSALPLKSVSKDHQNERSDFFRSVKSDFSAERKKIITGFFSDSDDTVKKYAIESREFVYKLYLFVSAFEKRYTLEKRRRDILDFNDLERIAFSLLIGENGEPTEIAKSVSEDFDEIYIDEYQDVNKLQDMIFTSISSSSSRFMVGDIKQSIYGFRGAEPSLFADYRLDGRIRKVFLRHNFRCDKPIIDFVNLVCGRLFTTAGKTVPYDSTDELVFAKSSEGSSEAEINIITSQSGAAAEMRAEEAAFVAERIRRLISEGYEPKDICILLRSVSRAGALFEEALKKINVPCKNQIVKDLFANPEVLLIMNILNVIDNPTRDIYLAGALKSPVFDFSLTELINIRASQKNGSLFDALKNYTLENSFKKGEYFLSKLEKYRRISFEPVDKLIWEIYLDTDIFAFVGEKENNKKNLLMLYEYARKFESGSFKGLYNFIKYVNSILESRASLSSAEDSNGEENAVKLMTIHQSKGLEFPVVLLCDTASGFSDEDSSEKVLIDKNFGTAMKLSDESGLASFDTVMRRAEALGIAEKNIDEEIRVLYVALTRAVNKLIITASSKEPEELIQAVSEKVKYSSFGNGYLFKTEKDFISWILISTHGRIVPNIIPPKSDDQYSDTVNTASIVENTAFDDKYIKELKEEFEARFDFEYSGITVKIPAKLSVSELYPEVLDDFDTAFKLSGQMTEKLKKPRLYSGKSITGADRGTATHQFMQFCNLKRLSDNGVESEIKYLSDNGFIDKTANDLIDKAAVKRFMLTELFSELCEASFLKRELRFNIRLPASLFTVDEGAKKSLQNEYILVQGIMDCVFIDKKERLTVLDYKTDRIPQEIFGDIHASEEYLVNKHINQLSYYSAACDKMMCRKVDRVILYSFALSRAIEVKCRDILDYGSFTLPSNPHTKPEESAEQMSPPITFPL